jgi:hypothetical protein
METQTKRKLIYAAFVASCLVTVLLGLWMIAGVVAELVALIRGDSESAGWGVVGFFILVPEGVVSFLISRALYRWHKRTGQPENTDQNSQPPVTPPTLQ